MTVRLSLVADSDRPRSTWSSVMTDTRHVARSARLRCAGRSGRATRRVVARPAVALPPPGRPAQQRNRQTQVRQGKPPTTPVSTERAKHRRPDLAGSRCSLRCASHIIPLQVSPSTPMGSWHASRPESGEHASASPECPRPHPRRPCRTLPRCSRTQ